MSGQNISILWTCARTTLPMMDMCLGNHLIPQLTGPSVAGGSLIPLSSSASRQPGSMAHSKTYNSVVLLLMSQIGAVLKSHRLSRLAQNLQNLITVQYIRCNIKREGFCEINNVRPLAILVAESSHSNAPLYKSSHSNAARQNGGVCNVTQVTRPCPIYPTNYHSKCYSIRILYQYTDSGHKLTGKH